MKNYAKERNKMILDNACCESDKHCLKFGADWANDRAQKIIDEKEYNEAALFDQIKHGDQEHQNWLKEKIEKHFSINWARFNKIQELEEKLASYEAATEHNFESAEKWKTLALYFQSKLDESVCLIDKLAKYHQFFMPNIDGANARQIKLLKEISSEALAELEEWKKTNER